MNHVKLYSSNDFIKIQRIRMLLQEQGVHLFHQPSVTSGIFGINHELEIVISEDDLRRALRLIEEEGIDISDYAMDNGKNGSERSSVEKMLIVFLTLLILAMMGQLIKKIISQSSQTAQDEHTLIFSPKYPSRC